jgi:hypothetical protein
LYVWDGTWVDLTSQGSGSTNLSYTPSASNGVVNSSTGSNATIPATDAVNAGLLLPAKLTEIDAATTKLAGIENNATADQSNAEIKTAYESNANTNAYTDSEKTKLAGLESSRFLGEYISLAALNTAHPTASAGDYANVDTGVTSDVVRYVWDVSDTKWVEQLGTSTQLTNAQIKTQYETNADTNAYTDAEKTKLAGVSGTNTGDEPNASTTVKGIVELATVTETNARTDATRVVTPAGIAAFPRKFSQSIGTGIATSIAVAHNLGTKDVVAQVYRVTTPFDVIDCEVVQTSTTQTTFNFNTAPASNEYRVVIIG